MRDSRISRIFLACLSWWCLAGIVPYDCGAGVSRGADPVVRNGLVLWLDAADIDGNGAADRQPDTGTAVDDWMDKSGMGNHVQRADGREGPVLQSGPGGSSSFLHFDGHHQLTRDRFEGFTYRDQPMHVVIVMSAKTDPARATPRLLEFQPVNGDLRKPATVKQHGFWIGTQSDGRMRLRTHYGDDGVALSTVRDNQTHVIEVVYAGAQSWVHYLDGARDGAGLLGDRDFHGFTSELRLSIGQQYGEDDVDTYFFGDVGEVLIYNRVLSAQEQNDIKAYLSNKWSLDLAIHSVPQFEQDVLPLLAAHCHDCHGAEVREGNVDLRTVSAMLRGGERGPVISRGRPEFSDLFQLIVAGKMPPADAEPMPADAADTIRRWIEAGAPSNESLEATEIDSLVTDEDRQFWAYQPLERPRTPKLTDEGRVRTPIDAFVLAKLEPLGLSFAPEAERRVLALRTAFDLTGLPLSPEEIDRFVMDPRPQAYEQLIDRLLASPHFGERWGRRWLDWSGYVDVYGKDNDFSIIKPLTGRWRYRDYVIESWNQSKPIDRFLIEQLAGDELVDWRSAEDYTPDMLELLTATGFLLCSDDDTDQNELNTPDIRHHVLQNTGEIVANNLFALTLQCAKCHNHKYEAISQLDYYRWLAHFSPVFNPQRWVTSVEHGIADVPKTSQKLIDQHNAEIDRQLQQLNEQKKASADKSAAEQMAKWDQQLASLQAQRKSYGTIQVAVESSPPSATYLLRRGEVTQPGPEVQPALLSVLRPTSSPTDATCPQPRGATSGRRLALAQQVTDPNSTAGALVTRVFVNRLWQDLLGQGLVATSDNFGVSGSRPTHPELLDWLAAEFVRSGWQVKPLIRLIMLSSVYRQDTVRADTTLGQQVDPSNAFLWRAPLRRLEAEIVRDRILAVSGQLDRSIGGAPVPLLAQTDGKIVVDMDSLPTPTSHWRRSLYLLNRRHYHLSMLTTFDQPFLVANCTQRKPSAVVTQSLTMLNDEFILQQARFFAERVMEQSTHDSPDTWVNNAFQLALGRYPTADERQLCLQVLQRQADRNDTTSTPQDQPLRAALIQLCHTLLDTNEFLFVP